MTLVRFNRFVIIFTLSSHFESFQCDIFRWKLCCPFGMDCGMCFVDVLTSHFRCSNWCCHGNVHWCELFASKNYRFCTSSLRPRNPCRIYAETSFLYSHEMSKSICTKCQLEHGKWPNSKRKKNHNSVAKNSFLQKLRFITLTFTAIQANIFAAQQKCAYMVYLLPNLS